MAPEVERGEEATPAADSYSLGVMFVYLLTGIWYVPGSKVFKLLETLEYRWNDVLPQLLADNPADRPTNLTELAASLRHTPVAVPAKTETPSKPPPKRSGRPKLVIGILVGVVAIIAAVVAFLVFSRQSAPAVDSGVDDAFGIRGIYERP